MNIKTELTVDKEMFELLDIAVGNQWSNIQTQLLRNSAFLLAYDNLWWVIGSTYHLNIEYNRWIDSASSMSFTDRSTLRLTMNGS